MPIIEQISPETPLSQGDILQGIKLFSNGKSWGDAGAGGTPVVVNQQLCLVASRPCNCQHKEHVVVLAVEKYSDGIPKEVTTFEDIKGFLKDVRDGNGSPDVFYIGEVPNKAGRFAARFDSFHSVQIPKDGAERGKFVADFRIGRLHFDFVRELHARMFRAFASLGFDDLGWLSDQDLRWLIQKGSAELEQARAKKLEIEAARLAKEFSAQQLSSKITEDAEKQWKTAEAELAPYLAEQEKRKTK